MDTSYLLCLTSLAILVWPYMVVPSRCRKADGWETRNATFQAFRFLDITWIAISVFGIGWFFSQSVGIASTLDALSILVASIGLPINLLAGLTGYYPERTRSGYRFYASRFPLMILGWIQVLALCAIILIAAIKLFNTQYL